MDKKTICDDKKRIKFKGELDDKYYDMSLKEKKSFLHMPNLDYSKLKVSDILNCLES